MNLEDCQFPHPYMHMLNFNWKHPV